MINYIKEFFSQLYILLNEMSPYLLLGFLFAGILNVFFPKDKVTKYLGKNNFRSVLNATLLGIPLPLCSCGVIPTGISFQKNGASKGASVAFLISTPQTGVDSMMVTYSLLGLPFAIIRPIIALFTGIFGGLLTNFAVNKTPQIEENIIADEQIETGNKLIRMFKYGFVTFLQDLSKWLVIGILIAAGIAVFIPDNFFAEYMSNPFLEMLIVLLISIPMYVCATGSVPIAMVLMLKGLSPGAALVFLMAGPATNAATIAVIGKSLGKKTLLTYLSSIIGGAVISGLFINYLLPLNWFTIMDMTHLNHLGHESHEILPIWFKISSSVLLIALIINGYVLKYFDNKKSKIIINKENINVNVMKTLKISVEGMTCNHCKMNVEKNLGKLEGIKQVNANVTNAFVEIEGEVDLKLVENMINDLGYSYKGEIK